MIVLTEECSISEAIAKPAAPLPTTHRSDESSGVSPSVARSMIMALPGSAQPEVLCLQTPGIPRLAGRNTFVNQRRKRWRRHVLDPYSKTERRRWDCCAMQIAEAVRPERRDRQGRCLGGPYIS